VNKSRSEADLYAAGNLTLEEVDHGAQRKVATKKQLNFLAGQVAKWFRTNKTW
jgi:hypothetical protein